MVISYVILKKLFSNLTNSFVNVGLNGDSKIPKAVKHFNEYMANIKVNKTFCLTPVTPQELFDIILAFDGKKSSGPNTIPVYILKISYCFFSDKLYHIVNLSFKAGIFPDLCKLAKVIPIFKKENPLLCVNYRPISLLP